MTVESEVLVLLAAAYCAGMAIYFGHERSTYPTRHRRRVPEVEAMLARHQRHWTLAAVGFSLAWLTGLFYWS